MPSYDSIICCMLRSYLYKITYETHLLHFQNNLDELFMLMHFLDAGKVSIHHVVVCSGWWCSFPQKYIIEIDLWTSWLFSEYMFYNFLQFGSLEEFQEEFKDINQEEQISRLHKMLAPHLLRSIILKLLQLTKIAVDSIIWIANVALLCVSLLGVLTKVIIYVTFVICL